jgi:hypothetical protein
MGSNAMSVDGWLRTVTAKPVPAELVPPDVPMKNVEGAETPPLAVRTGDGDR